MTGQPIPIPGKGITPEAAEALGLDPSDPRIAISLDDNDSHETYDDGVSDPFPSLGAFGGESYSDVPPDLSTGDSVSDEGIGEGSGEPLTPVEGSPRKRVSRLRAVSDDSGHSGARDATNKPPSLDEWTNFFGKIVLKIACNWYIDYAFRGVDEDMLSEREVERLIMTDDERKLIATPLAELSNKSKFMRKHGRTIVAGGDTFQAFVILGAWMSRVNRIAAKYKPRNPRVRVNMDGSNGRSGEGSQPSTPYTEGTQGGRVPNGYPIYRGSSG